MVLKVNDLTDHLSSAVRWITLTGVVIAFMSLCFWILAPWQLGKNSRTEIYNKTVQQALATPAMPLYQVHHGIPDEAHIWRLVTISGHFMRTPLTTERLRLVNEQPAIKSLTAFQTDNGKNIIIYRGYQDIDHPNLVPLPVGKVLLTARMHINEELIPGKEGAINTPHGLQIYSINSQILSEVWKLPLEPGYFVLENGSPGALSVDPLPELKTGPYLSYGIQWIAFGILAPSGLIYLIYQERKHRQQLNENRDIHTLPPETETKVSAWKNGEVPSDNITHSQSTPKTNMRLAKKAHKKQLLTQLRGENHNEQGKLDALTALDASIASNTETGSNYSTSTEIDNRINMPDDASTGNNVNNKSTGKSIKVDNIDITRARDNQSSAIHPPLIDNTEILLRDRYGKKS